MGLIWSLGFDLTRISELEVELEYWKDAHAAISGGVSPHLLNPKPKAQASQPSVGDGKAKGKGKDGKDKPKQHGGWQPKCGRLVKAYMNDNWARCDKLCKEYYRDSAIIKNVVDGWE